MSSIIVSHFLSAYVAQSGNIETGESDSGDKSERGAGVNCSREVVGLLVAILTNIIAV